MVKSVIMVVFREGKSQDEEMKYWNFWHSRQHSVKQRILDADTKNSVGLTHPIEEISHNALAVYWNPFESAAKVSFFKNHPTITIPQVKSISRLLSTWFLKQF